jgi:hypothetical protein
VNNKIPARTRHGLASGSLAYVVLFYSTGCSAFDAFSGVKVGKGGGVDCSPFTVNPLRFIGFLTSRLDLSKSWYHDLELSKTLPHTVVHC